MIAKTLIFLVVLVVLVGVGVYAIYDAYNQASTDIANTGDGTTTGSMDQADDVTTNTVAVTTGATTETPVTDSGDTLAADSTITPGVPNTGFGGGWFGSLLALALSGTILGTAAGALYLRTRNFS